MKTNLGNGLEISRIVHGHWRLAGWNRSPRELATLTREVADLGVTTIDTADIYGDYTCEKLFGEALRADPSLRKGLQIITKCGIKLISDKFPGRKYKHYDYSYDHLVFAAESSLKNLATDHLDLLLLHRPAPFFDPEAVARAFSDLKKAGKVLHFGVSNFEPVQFEMLSAYTEDKLVTNQVEISPWCLTHFGNGNVDFFLREKIRPMAWSPLGGGRIKDPADEKDRQIRLALEEVATELEVVRLEQVALAWLLCHPATIIPIVGSGRPERIRLAADSLRLRMSTEQWYRIYTAAAGKEVP